MVSMQLNRNDSFALGIDDLSRLPDPGFFEGAEKLLELWFSPCEDGRSLREIGRADLEAMLALVKCEIVGTMSNDHCDSYVLRCVFVLPAHFGVRSECVRSRSRRTLTFALDLDCSACFGLASVRARDLFLCPVPRVPPTPYVKLRPSCASSTHHTD